MAWVELVASVASVVSVASASWLATCDGSHGIVRAGALMASVAVDAINGQCRGGVDQSSGGGRPQGSGSSKT